MSKGQRHFYSLYLGLSTYSAFMAPNFKYFEQMAWNNNTIITKVVSIGRQGADAKYYKGTYVTWLSFHVTQFWFFHYFHVFILLSLLISATVYILALQAVFV